MVAGGSGSLDIMHTRIPSRTGHAVHLPWIHSNWERDFSQGSKNTNSKSNSYTNLTQLKIFWRDRNISVPTTLHLFRSLVVAVFLYVAESWTMNAEIENSIHAFELNCYRRLLGIHTSHTPNTQVRELVTSHIRQYDSLLTTAKKGKLRCFSHSTRAKGTLAAIILQRSVEGARKSEDAKNLNWWHQGLDDEKDRGTHQTGWKLRRVGPNHQECRVAQTAARLRAMMMVMIIMMIIFIGLLLLPKICINPAKHSFQRKSEQNTHNLCSQTIQKLILIVRQHSFQSH